MIAPRAECERIVRDCVTACAAAQDERGRWRPMAACIQDLAKVYGPSAANAATAAAARRLGAWLGDVKRCKLPGQGEGAADCGPAL